MDVRTARDKWDELASKWTLTGPPASPSAGDVDSFRLLLTETNITSSDCEVMLLGCTPSLRELLAEFGEEKGARLVCVDISEKMYERTSGVIARRNPRESFTCADWLTMDVGKERFCAVLGDKVIDNVMPVDWEAFFRRLHFHLRPGGLLILHLAPQDMALKGMTFRLLLARWADRYRSRETSLARAVSGLWEEVLGASAVRTDKRHDTQQIGRFADEVMETEANPGAMDRAETEVFRGFHELFWQSKNDTWSSYDYDGILQRLGPFFMHEKTLYSHDYPAADHQPVVRLRRRDTLAAG